MGVSAASGSAEVRAALEGAEQAAREEGAAEVSAEHVIVAIAQLRPGVLAAIFERYKLTPDAIVAALPKREAAAGNGGGGAKPSANGPLPPAPEIAAAVSRAGGAASAPGRPSFDATDLFLALLQDRASRVTELLSKRFGLTCEKLVQDLRAIRGQERMVARAEGEDACGHHAGAPGAAEQAGVDAAAAGGVGLAAELRDLEARHRALCENFNAVRDRQLEMVKVLRRLWVLMFLLLGGLAGLAYVLLAPGR